MKLKYFLLIFLLIMPASASFNPIRENKEAWTCYDHALNFSENNPDWGVVCMSQNRYFKGVSHFVNYKYISENELLIHDETTESEYLVANWGALGYYHFFINEFPCRYYRWMVDNRGAVIK